MSKAALSVRPRAARKARLRTAVFARDTGVCALCGRDTEAVRWALSEYRRAARGSRKHTAKYREIIKKIGARPGAPLWEADHVVPLSEGGADSLANLRTLCAFRQQSGGPSCHAKVTRELAARRARRPKARR